MYQKEMLCKAGKTGSRTCQLDLSQLEKRLTYSQTTSDLLWTIVLDNDKKMLCTMGYHHGCDPCIVLTNLEISMVLQHFDFVL